MLPSSGQLAGTALVLALVAAALLLFLPLASTESLEVGVDPMTGEQQEVRRGGSETLLESEGASVLLLLTLTRDRTAPRRY